MPSLSNTTLSSSPDQSECQYWSSFSEKPFRVGDRLQVYKGKLNGKGPRRGDFTVTKVFADLPGTETRCCQELAKFQAGCEWLHRFLSCGRYQHDLVRFAQLQKAPVDRVSWLNKVLSHSRRRPSPGEWVLLEELLQGSNLVHFVNKHGNMFRERTQSAGSPPASDSATGPRRHSESTWGSTSSVGSGSKSGGSACSLDTRHLLEAFVHYSYVASGGQLVVAGLEGVADTGDRLVLKTPVIHTVHRMYGETDLGPQGVRQVINNHVCNHHCHRVLENHRRRHNQHHHDNHLNNNNIALPSFPGEFLRSPPPYSDSQSPIPSAPFDPDVFTGSSPIPVPGGCTSGTAAPPYEMVDLICACEESDHLDVFPPSYSLEGLKLMMLHLGDIHPKDPPPPYTQNLL